MSDNEIEYLGTMPPSMPAQTTTPVAGIALTVTAGDEPNRTLRFLNYPATREITIGRASSSSPRKIGGPDGLHASFRCPVISRKHASIAFMSTGFVSITDLRSHHGTYVRKAGSPSGRTLLPNLAFQLNDGDFVTFGKKVAKDDGWVDPVTVQVRFMDQHEYARDDSIPAPTSSSIGISHSNSGRYGITMGDIYSSSSSDGEYSDDDDAPEELPIARGPALLDRLSESVELPPMRSSLAKFLPSYNHHRASPELGDFSVSQMFNDYARAQSPFIVGAYPASEDDREDVGRAPDNWPPAMAPWRWDELKGTAGEPQREEEESMDMDSNSGAEPANSEPVAAEPIQATHDVVQMDVAPVVEEPAGNARVEALEARLTVLDDAIVNLRGNALRDHLEARKTHAADISKLDALGTRTDELNTSLTQLRERVDEDEWAQYEDLSGDITDVRHQVEQLDDLINDLRGDLEGTDDTAHDLRMRVEVLEGMRVKADDESQAAREAEAQALQGLVTEVRTLRDDFKHALEALAAERAQIQAEREAGRTEREAAQAERAAMQAERMAAQAERERTPPRQLKRKHNDLEGEDESEDELTRALVPVHQHKRARMTAERVASTVARGTAYAAVGAVAAWSALAFA